jgi:hypothetical protein
VAAAKVKKASVSMLLFTIIGILWVDGLESRGLMESDAPSGSLSLSSNCTLAHAQLSFDFRPLMGWHHSVNQFTYYFSICGAQPPPPMIAACNGIAPSSFYQVGRLCIPLSDGEMSSIVPAPMNHSRHIPVRTVLLLRGGSVCGTSTRGGEIQLECADSEGGGVVVADVVETRSCYYTARVKHRAACPLECPRDSSGIVCGGDTAGVCVLEAPGAAPRCACASGFTGRSCSIRVLRGLGGGGVSHSGFSALALLVFASLLFVRVIINGATAGVPECRYGGLFYIVLAFLLTLLFSAGAPTPAVGGFVATSHAPHRNRSLSYCSIPPRGHWLLPANVPENENVAAVSTWLPYGPPCEVAWTQHDFSACFHDADIMFLGDSLARDFAGFTSLISTGCSTSHTGLCASVWAWRESFTRAKLPVSGSSVILSGHTFGLERMRFKDMELFRWGDLSTLLTLPNRTAVVMVCMGIHDLQDIAKTGEKDPQVVIQRYMEQLSELLSHLALLIPSRAVRRRLLWFTLSPPEGGRSPFDVWDTPVDLMRALNAEHTRALRQFGCTVVDLVNMTHHPRGNHAKTVSRDGLHYNPQVGLPIMSYALTTACDALVEEENGRARATAKRARPI